MKKNILMIVFLMVFIPTESKSVGIEFPDYDRRQWPHWSFGDTWGDKLDTRQELLIEASLVPVTTECSRRKCFVTSGRWVDFYTGIEIVASTAREVALWVTIEHVLTLYEAHYSGGAWWPRKLKKQLANDKRFLVVVSRSTNSSRGGTDIFLPEYLPCRFVNKYVDAKTYYGLFFDLREALFYSEKIVECGGDPFSMGGIQ